jgi:hypothetical protein
MHKFEFLLHLNTICTNMESLLPLYHLKQNMSMKEYKMINTLIKVNFSPKRFRRYECKKKQ